MPTLFRPAVRNEARQPWTQQPRGAAISLAKQKKAAAGWSSSKAPLGYQNSRKGRYPVVLIDPSVAPLIVLAFTLLRQKGASLRRVLAELTRQGLRSKMGKVLSYSTFRGIITNPFYAGYIRVDGTLYKGKHESLVSEAHFWQVQALLSERQNRSAQAQTTWS